MAKNINQVYMANPITSNSSTDLMYFGQSPYGIGNDAAMTYANFSAQFSPAGSGTVNTGIAQQVGYYASNGKTISGFTVSNNSALTANGSGNLAALGYSTTATASNLVERDSNANTFANNDILNQTSTAAGGTINLSNSSSKTQLITGSGATTVVLPDATTLALGWTYYINNNTASTVTVQYHDASTTLTQILAGMYVQIYCNGISSSNGTWDYHWLIPSNMANGQVVIGSTTSGPKAANLTAGTGISITNAANSITVATTGAVVTPSALTASNDTNVTLSLGGSPSTALVNAASITAGWTGTLSGTRGGTGVNNGASTITLGGSLTTSGAFSSTFTMTNTTAVTFPTSGTLATTSQIPSLPLSLANGGTAANLTANTGGIVYSGASALAILAGTATAGQIIRSGASAAPTWSTTTYPATNAINTLLYASSANVMSALATANSSVLVTSSGGVPSLSTTLPSGIAATNMNLTTPTIDEIEDTNGNKILQFITTATAVNFLRIQNAATGGAVGLIGFGTDANVLLQLRGRGNQGAAIQGTTAADNAAAGYVGEVISSSIAFASAISISNNTAKNLTSISLTAGDWDIYGNIFFNGSGAFTQVYAWTSTTSAALPDNSLLTGSQLGSGNYAICGLSAPYLRVNVSTTTTVYVSGYVTISSGNVTMCGNIYARRVR